MNRPFYTHTKKTVRSLTKPIRFKYCGELYKEIEVTYWIEKTSYSFFWGLIKFDDCTLKNNFNEIKKKELNYRLLSLNDIVILDDMVKLTEIQYKLDNIDLFFTLDV